MSSLIETFTVLHYTILHIALLEKKSSLAFLKPLNTILYFALTLRDLYQIYLYILISNIFVLQFIYIFYLHYVIQICTVYIHRIIAVNSSSIYILPNCGKTKSYIEFLWFQVFFVGSQINMNLLMIIKALCIILDTTIDTICKIELMFISISDFV